MDITLTKEQVLLYAKRYREYDTLTKSGVLPSDWPPQRTRGYLTRDDLTVVARWKSSRRMPLIESNTEDDVREVSRVSFATTSERLRIGALRVLDGIEWPRASAILHFAFPERYPVLDVRAMRTVGGSVNYTFERWDEYARLCRSKATEYGVTMRDLDRALWTYDKERKGNVEGGGPT